MPQAITEVGLVESCQTPEVRRQSEAGRLRLVLEANSVGVGSAQDDADSLTGGRLVSA
jgi:hypothetical protein